MHVVPTISVVTKRSKDNVYVYPLSMNSAVEVAVFIDSTLALTHSCSIFIVNFRAIGLIFGSVFILRLPASQ